MAKILSDDEVFGGAPTGKVLTDDEVFGPQKGVVSRTVDAVKDFFSPAKSVMEGDLSGVTPAAPRDPALDVATGLVTPTVQAARQARADAAAGESGPVGQFLRRQDRAAQGVEAVGDTIARAKAYENQGKSQAEYDLSIAGANVRATGATLGAVARNAELEQARARLAELQAAGRGESPQADAERSTILFLQGRVKENRANLAEAQQGAAEAGLGQLPAVRAMGDAKTARQAWDAFKQDPIGIVLSTTIQSAPNMVAGMAGAMLGGPAVGAAAAGLNSFLTEAASGLTEFAQRQGVDTSDKAALAEFFADPKWLREGLDYASKGALPVAVLDAVSMGIASRVLVPAAAVKSRAVREVLNIPAQAAAQGAAGGAGEAGKQIVQKGRVTNWGDVGLEVAGELGSVPGDIISARRDIRDAILPAAKPEGIVIQSPAAEAAGLPPLVVPPKSPAVAAAEAAAQAEKAPEGGKAPPAGETAPAQAAPIAVAPTPQPAAAVVPGAPTGFEDFTGPEAAAEILGPATPSGNIEPATAPATPAVAPSGNTAAVAPTAQAAPQDVTAAPQAAPQADRGVDAVGRLTALLQDARKGYDQAQHEYETTGRDTTYNRLRKHLLKSFTPLLGRKDAQAYVQYLTEEGGLGGGDLGTGSEYFDLAAQALAKQTTSDARASKAEPAAPAPVDLPESFPTKSEANLFAVRNKLTDVRAVQSGVGWTLQPVAAPPTAQEIARDDRHVQALNEAFTRVGVPVRVVPVRDAGTEQGAVTRAISQVLGFPQVLVRGLTDNAVYYQGVSFVSAGLSTTARVIHGALHEAFHWAVQNHPDVAQKYLDAIGPLRKAGVLETRQTFENAHKAPGEKHFPLSAGRDASFGKVNSAEEEVGADVWGGMGIDPQFWVEMRQKDPGLFRAIRYRFLETLSRAIDALSRKGIRTHDLVTEYEKARDATSTAMAEVAKRGRAPAAGKADTSAAPRAENAPTEAPVAEPDVRASKLDEDMVKRDDGSREYALNVERDERKRAKRAVLTNEERAAVEHDAAVHGVDAKEWIAKAEKTKKSYPESAGWAPLRLVGLTNEEETDENGDVKKDIKLKWQQQGYGFQIPPGKTKGPTSIDTRWAEQLAVRVAAEVRSVLKRAAAGDRNAMIIVQHQTWYRNMAMILRRAFGGKGDFFADLLGATSPQTDVPTNWRSAVDIIKRFSQGEFRREMKAAQEWLAAGKELRDMPGGDKIRKLSGKLYGINSPNAVRALLNLYRNIEPDSAPKAKNFAMNLIGESDMANIDVWAARMLRRMAQAVEKAGYERIPPPAEKGVSGKWNADATKVGGEFGFGAAVLRLASTILKDEGIDVSAPDLQAVAWFIEKELWTKKNWTSKSGEGGSFEEQVDQTQPERLITGWTIATSESTPSDAQMSVAQARVLTVLRGDDTVLAARALPTTGMYAGDTERSFDNEIVVTPGFDPHPLVAEIARIAREAKQYDIFVSKVLHDSASSVNARPGVEIYFRGQKAFDEARSVLDEVVANGLDGFTLVVDPRTENSDAPGSEVGKYVGVRLQYIPEIEMRWLDPTSDRYKTLSSGTPAEIAAIIEDKRAQMADVAAKIAERSDVAHAALRWYDTVVIGKENYSDYTDGAGTNEGSTDRGREAPWFGQPLGEVLARADSRLRGDGRQEPDGGVRDGGVAGVQPAGADVRRSRIDEAAGSAEPADRPRGSGIAGAQRGAEDARGWSKRSPQPLSVSVDAWHYGLERTGVLSGLYYGRGIKGKERERVFADRDWRVQRRVYFYIPKDDGSLPAKEDGLGNHRYEVRLGNLYDGAVDDARVGPSAAADFETKVLDAGYDGYISRKLGMAVVLNADVPATYKGIDQHGPARAEPPAQARLKKALLRGEIDAVDKALPALKAADPTLRARNGSVEYDPAARDALNAVGADGLPRFSKSDALGFYSQLERVVENAPIKVAPAEQWKAWLNGNAAKLGVKADEIAWSGIADWLDMQKGKVTREAVSEYLAANGVRVEETVLGADTRKAPGYYSTDPEWGETAEFDSVDEAIQAAQSTFDLTHDEAVDFVERTDETGTHPNVRDERTAAKYENYVLPGGKNYRELLLTLPSFKSRDKINAVRDQLGLPPLSVEDYQGYLARGEVERDSAAKFQSHHWDQANVLAHIRFNERTDTDGKRVMFVEEIQSDWGQEGKKKKGFADPAAVARYEEYLSDLKRRVSDDIAKGHDAGVAPARAQQLADKMSSRMEPWELAKYVGESEKLKSLWDAKVASEKGIPNAPFVTKTEAWVALALKRAISYAVQNGFDKVAFTNGAQNADRYDLSKQLDTLLFDPWQQGGGEITARKDGANVITKKVFNNADVADVVGKDLAQQLLAAPRNRYGMHELSGLDLKVGGEGMVAFYDKIVPQVARDVLKKIGGGQMGTVEIKRPNASRRDKLLAELEAEDGKPRARTSALTQPGFDITPAMRERVAAGGLPRFSKAQENTPEFKRWFGDSKVVDANGKPLVVYHGTFGDFSQFAENEKGMFFATTGGRASAYLYHLAEGRNGDDFDITGANVMPVYLSIKNPLLLNTKTLAKIAKTLAIKNVERFIAGFEDSSTAERDAVRAYAKSAGHDGLVIARDLMPVVDGRGDWGFTRAYVAFDPEQIKSATGNNGEYDPANPDIRRSIANGTSNWDSTQSGRLDDLLYALQDKQIDLKRIQKQITSAGNQLSIRSDAYLREELYHGRVADRTLNFLNDELQPLFTEMRAANVALPELEQYLHARHAEERNLYLESINQNTPNNTDLSGMSTADANAILASARPVMQTLAARVDRIINGTRDLMEIAGLEDPTDVASLRGAYQHYVPLHRDEAHPGTRPITNSGFSVKGTNIKRALGSHAAVTNILAHVVAAREAEITRAEKNAVALAVYALASNNPNPDFWSTDTPPKAPWLDPRKEVYNPGTGQMEPNPNYNQVVMRADPNWARQPNVLAAKLNGVEVGVIFNEHDERAVRMVTSLKNLDVNGLDAAAKVIAKATRWQAAVNTSFSPVFMVTNLLRDVHGAAVNLTSTEISGKQVAVLAGATPAARAIYRAERGKAINDPVWGPLYAEFKRRGAKTGYRDAYVDIEDRARALQKEIDALDRKAPARVAHAIADFMADANTTTENAVRLSAYKVAIDQGIHPDRAASIAKNLTVNFNRKGAKTQGIGAFYAFFNAAVQGTARTAETLTGKGAAKVIAGGLLLGVLQSLMYAGMDDEDEEAIPDYVKRTSIVIPLKHSYIAIPMPLGLHVVPNVGRTIADVALALRSGDGRQVAGKIWSLVGTLFDTINPLGSSETPLQMAAPTVADPFVQLWTNQNFVGNPVYRERGRDDQGAPGYTLGRDSTNPFYKGAAYVIHMLGSGMNPYSRNTSLPAALSPQPEAIRLFPETIFGGLWRETEKLVDTTIALATGQPVDPNRVPMASRFYGDTTSNSAVASVFWKNVSKVSEVEREEKRARKDGGTPPQREDSPLVAGAKTARTQVLGLMGQRRQADINGATPTALREFDDKIAEVMRAFNKQAREAHKK